MMMKLSLVVVVLSAMAVALAAPRAPQQALVHQIKRGVAGPNPYIFLTVPKGRSQSLLQAFEVLEDDDEEERDNEAADNADDDDDDAEEINDDEEEDAKDTLDKMVLAEDQLEENVDDDDDEELDNVMSMNLKLRKPNGQIHNAKNTQMMITREHAGAILVPDEVIEIEGQSVIDEKTGKPALLLPRSVLDAIPDGSVVALMERTSDDDDEQAEERANRVIVRRRRKGARRNIRRRSGNKRRVNRRGVNNNRRRVNKRKHVRVIRRGGNKRRAGVVKRRVNRRRVSLQG